MKNLKNTDNNNNDQEISRKRRNSNSDSNIHHQDLDQELQFTAKKSHSSIQQQEDTSLLDNLALSLGLCNEIPKKPSSYPPFPLILPPEHEILPQHETLTATPSFSSILASPPPLMVNPPPVSSYRREDPIPRPARPPRARRSHTQTPCEKKPFPPPYPWAAEKKAAVRSLDELTAKRIEIITGLVQCKRCERQYELGFNLREKFLEVGSFIAENKESMHDRAPSVWMSPILPTCKFCEQENSVKPVISEKKKTINWLFLLLGQMLGCCTLDQLKYFCKHTDNHRTGAKDRVLYLTYLALCKQLDPDGPFDR